jgi:hypothetical protein
VVRAEVLEHLYLSYTGTTKGFSRLLSAEKPTAARSTWKQRRDVLIVLGLGYLPSGRESPPSSRPRGLPSEKVLAEVAGKIAEMDDMITNCEEKYGHGKLLDHPALGPLSGAEWRKFHLMHGRHHIEQIKKLKEGLSK